MKYFLGIVLLLALGVGGFWLLANKDTVKEVPLRAPAELLPLQAEVTRNGAATDSTTRIESGDRITTSPTGRAIITTGVQLITSLAANTDIEFNNSKDMKATTIEVAAGRVWSRLERALEQDEQYTVYTPTLAAAVRGTSFGTYVLDEVEKIVVGEGVVVVSNRSDETQSVSVTAGQTAEIIDGSLVVRPTNREDMTSDWYQEHMADDWSYGGSATLEAVHVYRDGFWGANAGQVRVTGRGFHQIRKVTLEGKPLAFELVSDRELLVPFSSLLGVRSSSQALIYYQDGTISPAEAFTGSYDEVRQNLLW